jgi:hypothetical protein
MKLREMLALIGGPTFLDDRAERLSGSSDELYDDETITLHLNEGQRQLCMEAWVLEDTSTAEVCQIALEQDQTDYTLHDSILGVKYVRLSDSEVDLIRVGYNDNRLHSIRPLNEPDFWDVNIPLIEDSGRPTRWSADIGTRTIRVRAKPDADSALLIASLAVVRTPIVDLTTASLEDSPEVHLNYHMLLCKYAAGCCASGGDVDSGLAAKGSRWLKEWAAGLDQARRMRQRLQTSQPQVRFGGWVNGR